MAGNQSTSADTEMKWREVVELGVTPVPAELAQQDEETEDDQQQAEG